MTKTLWLHVGHPKTGSTALQSFCGENRGLLSERGLSYPSMPDVLHPPNPDKNGLFLASGLTGANRPDPTPEQSALMQTCLDVIAREFETHDSVLVSEETIWTAVAFDKSFCWDVLTAHAREHLYTIKVIAYLRRQDLFTTSRYQQKTRTGKLAQRWESWLVNQMPVCDYHAVLSRFARIVGAGNIVVRIYDRTLLEKDGGNLFTDFLGALGISGIGDFKPPVHTKERTTSCNFTACMYALNASPFREGRYLGSYFDLACTLTEQRRSQVPAMQMFSPSEARAFMGQFEEGNKAIARDYLHRDGPLFDMTFPAAMKWKCDNSWMADDMLLFFQGVNRKQTELISKRDAGDAATYGESAYGESAGGSGSGSGSGLESGLDEGELSLAEAEDDVDGPSRIQQDFEAGMLGTREESTLGNVIRCLADFFMLRERLIKDGGTVEVMSDETVALLASSMLPQSDAHARLVGSWNRSREAASTARERNAELRERNEQLQSESNDLRRQLDARFSARLRRAIRRLVGRS